MRKSIFLSAVFSLLVLFSSLHAEENNYSKLTGTSPAGCITGSVIDANDLSPLANVKVKLQGITQPGANVLTEIIKSGVTVNHSSVSLSSDLKTYSKETKDIVKPESEGRTSSGGPDAFGYWWKDSNETNSINYSWIDISESGSKVNMNGDDVITANIDIGFDFIFYGQPYRNIKICSNGFLTFAEGFFSADYLNTTLPSATAPPLLLAPFWDDLRMDAGSSVYLWSNSKDLCIVSFLELKKYSGAGTYSFQVIMHKTGYIIYQYSVLGSKKDSCTIGIQNKVMNTGLAINYNYNYINDKMAILICSGTLLNSSTTTKEDGTFSFSSLKNGTYMINAENFSFYTPEPIQTVNLPEDTTPLVFKFKSPLITVLPGFIPDIYLDMGSTCSLTIDLINDGSSKTTVSSSSRTNDCSASAPGNITNKLSETKKKVTFDKTKKYAPSHLLVRFRDDVSVTKRKETISSIADAAIDKEYTEVPGLLLISFPAEKNIADVMTSLNNSDDILYAEPDYVVQIDSSIPDDPWFTSLWALHNTGQSSGKEDADIDAPEAWDSFIGNKSIVVAVVDTGIDYNHNDIKDNMWKNPGEIPGNGIDDDNNGYVDDVYGYDFCNGDSNPMDDESHGTHVAGTIGAVGNNGIGVAGVNWEVSIMALKFLDSGGSGYTSDAISACEYAIKMGVRATNNSWGGGSYSASLEDVIELMGQKGILFVASAGNNYSNIDNYPQYPASYPCENIISVMATTRNDAMSSFSNYGKTGVDIGAPGTDIYSCIPGNNYTYKSGTSMASPHITGACAFLFGYNPSMTHTVVKQILMDTSDKIFSGLSQSDGRLNLSKAIESVAPAWLEVIDKNTDVPSGGSNQVKVMLNATELTSGTYCGALQFKANAAGMPIERPLKLHVLPSARLGFSSVASLTDSDMDTVLEAGEIVEFDIELLNDGLKDAYDVSVSLSSSDDKIRIISADSFYSFVQTGLTASGDKKFRIKISDTAPESCKALLHISINSAAGGRWGDDFEIDISNSPSVSVTPQEVNVVLGYNETVTSRTIKINNEAYGICHYDIGVSYAPSGLKSDNGSTFISLISEDFLSQTFNTTYWQSWSAWISDLGIEEPTSPYSLNLSGENSLESVAFDTSRYEKVYYEYYWEIQGNGESPDDGDNLLFEWYDGTTWKTENIHTYLSGDYKKYLLKSGELTGAALNNKFKIRFRETGDSGYDDYFVDNIRISGVIGGMEVSPVSGIINAVSSADIDLKINADQLLPGDAYKRLINVTTNDPDNNLLTVPVTIMKTSAPSASVSFEKEKYLPCEACKIIIKDGNARSPITVKIASSIDVEFITISEKYPSSGYYEGTLNLSSSVSPGVDGILATRISDNITGYYTDEDNGAQGHNMLKTAYFRVSNPDIKVSLSDFNISIPPDSQLSNELIISNTGSEPLNYSISLVLPNNENKYPLFSEQFPGTTLSSQNWLTCSAFINDLGVNEPSPLYSIDIDEDHYIESKPINTEGYSSVYYEYGWERGGLGDSPEYGNNLYFEYYDGTAWKILKTHTNNDGSSSEYTKCSGYIYNLNPANTGLSIRFRTTGDSGGSDDYFVDDIYIMGVKNLASILPGSTGTIYPASADSVQTININTTGFGENIYRGSINITSDDPCHESINIPMTIDVSATAPVPTPIQPVQSEWFYSGKVPGFSESQSFESNDVLGLNPGGSYQCFAYWVHDFIPVTTDRIYRLRWTLMSGIEDQNLSPQIRLRANQKSNNMGWSTIIDSSNNAAPSILTPKQYDVYIQPSGSSINDEITYSFDLLSFFIQDDSNAFMYFYKDLEIEEVDYNAASETPVVEYNFTDGAEGWINQEFIGNPEFSSQNGEIGITPNGNSGFGYWVSNPVSIQKDKIYLVTWHVRSSLADENKVPEFRLRVNQMSNNRGWLTNVISSAGNAPDADHIKTYSMFIEPQMEAATDNLVLSFDLMAFDQNDDLNGYVFLDKVTVDKIAVNK